MDIKSRNISSNKMITAAAFALCVVLFLSALTSMTFIFRITNYSGADDLLLYDSYEKSAAFQRVFDNKLNSILCLLDQYKSEEYIKSGKTVDEQRLDNALRTLFYDNNYSYQEYVNESYADTKTVTIIGAPPAERYGGGYDDPGIKEQFMKDYADKVDELKNAMIMDDLSAFEEGKKQLDRSEGFTYIATDGTSSMSNIGSPSNSSGAVADINFFKKAPAYLIYEGDNLSKVPEAFDGVNGSMGNFDKNLESVLDSHYNPELKVYFSFDRDFLDAKGAEFSKAKSELEKWVPAAIVCTLLSLILLIYLIITTGRRDENGNRTVHKVDKIFTELQLLIIGFFLVAGGFLFGRFLLETVNYRVYLNGGSYYMSTPLYLSVALTVLSGLLSAGFGLYFILSVVRNIKTGRFLKNSIIFIVITSIWSSIKDFYYGGSVMKKVVLVTLAVCILSATVVLAPVAGGLILVFAPKWVKKYEEIKRGVNEVKNGNLTYKIKVAGNGELDELARGINEISEASNLAVQNELKNQRLKTDLISNVSHDLKTPLTSIITYVDLLKQEGLDSPDAPKYLEILDQKSIRLKKLTEDLFDAAKASSGAIPVRFETVEMLSLINQGLGEMNDRIEASGLEFKINAQKEKYYVRADGQLLWRVVENLLSNVLKYAQEGSRVYIDLKEQNGKAGKLPNVILEIKNISRTELNIDADELMERFKRGDQSRTTEGSGLGLAIAKDLIRLQNGWFEIKIDGDLFKAIVMLEASLAGKEETPAV